MEFKFKVGSLLKREDRIQAARLLVKGEVIGVFNRGVCALWFDGANLNSVKRIWKIKGEERKRRSLSLTLRLEDFTSMIDSRLLPTKLRNLLMASDFKKKVGSLCFIRAPIRKSHQKLIPKQAQNMQNGVCMVQNWDAYGHDPIEKFLNQVRKLGVKYPAVTSMNVSREKEIVDQKEAIKFCEYHKIRIFLKDPKAHPKHRGSYTIFTFSESGIKLERDGNIPSELFKYIFGMPFDTKSARPAKHPQLKFPIHILSRLRPTEVRKAILRFLVQ